MARARLVVNSLETVGVSLRHRAIDNDTAMTWLNEEGLLQLARTRPLQARGSAMKNIDSMTTQELDALVIQADAGHGEKMLTAVYDLLGRFVAYPTEHARVAHSLWIVHAHLMDKWESNATAGVPVPEPASGKSRALEVSELLVPNPVQAVNVTPAYLFRRVGTGVTILFDEVDTVFGPKAKENEEIRGLLNAGHRRGAVAGRCVVHGKTVQTDADFPAYAPVALAGLGWLPDTIMSRAVGIRMRRRSKRRG